MLGLVVLLLEEEDGGGGWGTSVMAILNKGATFFKPCERKNKTLDVSIMFILVVKGIA